MTNLKNWITISPLIISLLLTAVILLFLQDLPPKLPLFYSLSWGEEQLATHQQFLAIPTSLTAITLLNLAVSWHLHSSQEFFKTILLITPLIISLILCLTFVKIILIFI